MKRVTILVIDDNPTNLEVLTSYLDDAGYKTLVAEDGESAMRRAIYTIPDLILLDIMMPGIDGYETCRQLKQNPITKDIPVIFVTALTALSNKVKGFQVGGIDYITKPYQYEEVLARINTHLTLQRQKKELAELNATKDTFFSIIAHDMRGAFTPLLGSSDVLVRKVEKYADSDPSLQKIANTIQMSVKNVHKLLDNLLDWGRLQRGKMECVPVNCSLYKVVSEVISLFTENASQKNINLFYDIPQDISIYADINMINTIIRNLVANAIKFTHSGGKVSVLCKKEQLFVTATFVTVTISDTGIGISAENKEKLFKIDQKFKGTGTNGEKGTGLGLILCKNLVEINKGKIWVDSENGKGSSFHFTVPLEKNP